MGVEAREGVEAGADACEVLDVLTAGGGALGRLGPKTYSSQPLGGSGCASARRSACDGALCGSSCLGSPSSFSVTSAGAASVVESRGFVAVDEVRDDTGFVVVEEFREFRPSNPDTLLMSASSCAREGEGSRAEADVPVCVSPLCADDLPGLQEGVGESER